MAAVCDLKNGEGEKDILIDLIVKACGSTQRSPSRVRIDLVSQRTPQGRETNFIHSGFLFSTKALFCPTFASLGRSSFSN